MSDQTKKLDAGKARLDLIPRRPLLDIAECLEVGAKKYAPHAWRKNPMEWSRVFAAMLRHAFAAMEGEERDPQDGQLHLAAVAVNAIFLLEYRHTNIEGDDRHIPADLDADLLNAAAELGIDLGEAARYVGGSE